MDLPSYFTDFLRTIRPQSNHVEDMRTGHLTPGKRLLEDESSQRSS